MEKIDHGPRELSCMWKINAMRKLGGGYLSPGAEGRDNVPEKRGYAGKGSSWKELQKGESNGVRARCLPCA